MTTHDVECSLRAAQRQLAIAVSNIEQSENYGVNRKFQLECVRDAIARAEVEVQISKRNFEVLLSAEPKE